MKTEVYHSNLFCKDSYWSFYFIIIGIQIQVYRQPFINGPLCQVKYMKTFLQLPECDMNVSCTLDLFWGTSVEIFHKTIPKKQVFSWKQKLKEYTLWNTKEHETSFIFFELVDSRYRKSYNIFCNTGVHIKTPQKRVFFYNIQNKVSIHIIPY